MDFSFTSEQEDLRREARSFLEANPSPSLDQLAALGWVGILQSDDFSFLDAAVLFEELGRVLYDGPFVLNEVAGQPGEEVWSIEIDGFVPHLDQVDRVLTPDMHGRARPGRAGRDGRRDAAPGPPRRERRRCGDGRLGRRAPSVARRDRPRGRRHRVEGGRARDRLRRLARAIRQEDRCLPGDLAPARRRVRRRRARTVAGVLGRLVASRRRTRRSTSPSQPRSRRQRRLPCSPASTRSRRTAASDSRGSTRLHRYYKRALWLEGALGYGRELRAEVAASLLAS